MTFPADLQSKDQKEILEIFSYESYTVQTENPSRSDSIKSRLEELKIRLSNLKNQN